MEPSSLSGFSPFLVPDAPNGASSSAAFACVLPVFFPPTFTGGFLDVACLFFPQFLRPAFLQEARRMPHWRRWGVLNARPLLEWDSV